MAAVSFRVLGPLKVDLDGSPVALGGPKQRGVLGLLLLEPNRTVPAHRIIELIWGEDASDRSAATLQVYVSNLRRALAPVGDALGTNEIIATQRPGYAALVPRELIDLSSAEASVTTARHAAAAGDHAKAAAGYDAALALWRGRPLADVVPAVLPERVVAAIDGMRMSLLEERLEAQLRLGRHGEVLGDVEALVNDHPLNERLRGLQMLALYRAGRQADALAAYQAARDCLVEELGIEPSPPLRELESRILAQDRSLDPPTTGLDVEVSTLLRSSVLVPAGTLVTEGKRIALDRAVVTIGRRPDRTIVLDDALASRLHAEVRMGPEGFTVVDAGSTNGTTVNGKRIVQHLLRDGDEIAIGRHVFRFESCP